MAKVEFILQAATTANHGGAVKKLLGISQPKSVLISVAFARSAGIETLQSSLTSVAKVARVFVGIRNDLTSAQAIKSLLATKVEVYVVDTGSRDTIFHPKIYLAANASRGCAIIGSANMTFNGLHNNIEASTILDLDFAQQSDEAFFDQLTHSFDQMIAQHPKHVVAIKSAAQVDALLAEGRVADETIVAPPQTARRINTASGAGDALPRMSLHRVTRTRVRVVPKVPKAAKSVVKQSNTNLTTKTPTQVLARLVWESKALTQRDLNIPTGKTTNATGSIGLKKGAFTGIDQRHYFRDDVFNELVWTKTGKLERAIGKFELIIKSVTYGTFDLSISHNPDTTSKTYKQNNMMTHLHWGDAKPLIAKKDLLDRVLSIYRKSTNDPEFVIEID